MGEYALNEFDVRKLPRDLTASERTVAEIAAEIGLARDNRTVTLTELVDAFVERTGRKRQHVRSTVNHFVKSVSLKCALAPELGWSLVSCNKLGRGNSAEFKWVARTPLQ